MATILVTYDLKQPGRDYAPVHRYLKQFAYCKGLESVWLLDTPQSTATIRDHLKQLVDNNDKLFVVKITREWASLNYGCGDWLNDPDRSW